jgi:two-component system cell cycle sensor histidine kinase/response regulator CckA
MLGPLQDLFSSDGFMPHGHCYMWNPTLIRIHVIADGITAVSYTSIPFSLAYFALKRRDIPFNAMFWCFGLFIVACGATHYMDIWTLWTPTYWLAGLLKAFTAAASLPTAIYLVRLMPQALKIPTPSILQATNDQLRKTSEELRATQARLEIGIDERTGALRRANAELVREIAERRQTEEALRVSQQKLRHAQKMEAVGRLAGGVAHDFNNLLSVVISYSAMLLETVEQEHPMYDEIKQIEAAGLRAEALTQQLLAFSRQQVLQPRTVDLNEVVQGVEKMLGRLIGEHIALETSLARPLGLVQLDPRQIEEVIVNLVVNARDAMPRGGRILISTSNTAADARGNATQVVLTISDDGEGMDDATLERIYEPFFTTKDVGKGTGLGLATVFGIVQQSGGRIDVESELGKGTSFRIYFSRNDEGITEPRPSTSPPSVLTGTETILVVEDETVVRNLVVEILHRHGYRVLSAANAHEALALSGRVTEPIHLLITDVIMPTMDGRELAFRIAETRRETRTLLMSGYPNYILDPRGAVDPGVHFLRKPIQPRALAQSVRDVLNGASARVETS